MYRMSTGREDSFLQALTALQDRLRDGRFRPGARIPATEVADALRLSATPVREALSRLAGEGLVEDRRGQGYFARSLSALDVADLYRISLAQLNIALDAHRCPLSHGERFEAAPAVPDRSDPVRTVERLFAAWVSRAGGRALAAAHRTLQIQLGPVRRVEPMVFSDLAREAADLVQLSASDRAGDRMTGLRRFHGRRIAAADRLYSLVERGPRIE
jgi:DNA-binding GntR family transcriptional regulator